MKHSLEMVGSESTYTNEKITRDSKKMVHSFPDFFRGSVYVANALFFTDNQYRKFAKKAYKIKLK